MHVPKKGKGNKRKRVERKKREDGRSEGSMMQVEMCLGGCGHAFALATLERD